MANETVAASVVGRYVTAYSASISLLTDVVLYTYVVMPQQSSADCAVFVFAVQHSGELHRPCVGPMCHQSVYGSPCYLRLGVDPENYE